MKGPHITPPIFEGDGLEIFDDWLPLFTAYSKEHKLDKRDDKYQVMALTNLMSRRIQKQVKALPGNVRSDFKAVVEWLKQRHGKDESIRDSKKMFKTRQREPKEKITDYVDLLRSYYTRGHPTATEST